MRLLTISPTAATASSERGDDSRRIAIAVSTARRSSRSRVTRAASAAARSPVVSTFTRSRCRVSTPIDAGVHSVRPALRVGGQREELIGRP